MTSDSHQGRSFLFGGETPFDFISNCRCVKAIMQWFPHCAQLDLCHTTFGSFTRTKVSSQSSRAKSSVYAELVSGHFLFSMGVHAKAACPAWRH
jgi:hypothetical protein